MAQQPQEKKVGSFTLIKTADKMTDEDRSRAITFGEDRKGHSRGSVWRMG